MRFSASILEEKSSLVIAPSLELNHNPVHASVGELPRLYAFLYLISLPNKHTALVYMSPGHCFSFLCVLWGRSKVFGGDHTPWCMEATSGSVLGCHSRQCSGDPIQGLARAWHGVSLMQVPFPRHYLFNALFHVLLCSQWTKGEFLNFIHSGVFGWQVFEKGKEGREEKNKHRGVGEGRGGKWEKGRQEVISLNN